MALRRIEGQSCEHALIEAAIGQGLPEQSRLAPIGVVEFEPLRASQGRRSIFDDLEIDDARVGPDIVRGELPLPPEVAFRQTVSFAYV